MFDNLVWNTYWWLGIITVVLLLVRLIQNSLYGPNWPPGPRGVPILGVLPKLRPFPFKYFFKLWKEYGPVVHVRMGSRDTIVINGYDACREALLSKGADFAGRPDFESIQCLSHGGSFGVLPYDDCWKLHKRISAAAMRKFTNQNHEQVDDVMRRAALTFVDKFLSSEQPVDPRKSIIDAAANVMFTVIFGEEMEYSDNPDYMAIYEAAEQFKAFTAAGGNPADLMPFLSILPNRMSMKEYVKSQERGIEITKKFIKAHLDTFDERNVRDIVDHLILAARDADENEKSSVGLTDDRIYLTSENLVRAGLSTTASTFQWSCMYMAAHQDVQKRAQKEIDATIGREGAAKASDSTRMPYIQACIHEIMRHVSPTPMAVPHSTIRDTSIYGYDIPKGTLVFFNLWSITRDESLWENPEKFNPDRFLAEDGTFDRGIAAKLGSFGFGKRRCLGEKFARLELFHFLLNLLQNVDVLPDNKNHPLSFDYEYLMTNDPKEFHVFFLKRA